MLRLKHLALPGCGYADFHAGVNVAMNLSEKGFEQASERGFSRCSVPKRVPILTLVRARFGHLQDFSDSFMKLSENPHERANLLAIRRLIDA
jgi:hypothetical protein